MSSSTETNLIGDSYISFVNLDHRKDRLRKMETSLGRLGLKAVRTRGMLPSEATIEAGGPARVAVMQNRTPGAIGCHFSQVRIMKEAHHLGKHAWVMEDDLVFCLDFYKRLQLIERFVDTHPWDIIWLGGTFHINPPWWHKKHLGRDAELTDDPRMIRTYGAFCTYAYIVNHDSIDAILRRLDHLVPVSIGIDWAMIQLQPFFNTFAFVPGCITQYDNMSDIGKGMTIFSNFRKLNGTIENSAYQYQDMMEKFNPEKFNWHEANIK